MRRGEIWWVELPDRKRRPYVVLTRDAAIDVLTSVVAVAVTRTVRGLPTELELGEDRGLPSPCVASLDNIETLPKWAFTGRAGELDDLSRSRLCLALRTAVDC